MDGMLASVLIGNLSFAVLGGAVGVRLMRLAARTRQLPELLLGFGLFGMVLGILGIGASGVKIT